MGVDWLLLAAPRYGADFVNLFFDLQQARFMAQWSESAGRGPVSCHFGAKVVEELCEFLDVADVDCARLQAQRQRVRIRWNADGRDLDQLLLDVLAAVTVF